jgi:phosphatidylserine/phosphatidylglycerophosphate/cardiolipin synthase-like enzyme
VDFVEPRRGFALELVGGRGHYDRVVRAVMDARRSVWIATANLKELMVEDHRARPGRRRTMRAGRSAAAYRSMVDVFAELAGRGVELRILHAAQPSGPFRAALAKTSLAAQTRGRSSALPDGAGRGSSESPLALRACPRVHFKAVVVDGAFVYVGSANWTGAGLGAKGTGRRNFELGFAGSDDGLLDRVQEVFDRVWRGAECKGCKLRDVCPAPLDTPRAL